MRAISGVNQDEPPPCKYAKILGYVANMPKNYVIFRDDSYMSLLHLEAPKYFLRHLFASTFV